MNEHLFKLKKDGKMVGYMHFFGAYAHYKSSLSDENWRSQRLFENLPEVNTSVTKLTAHPFVTKDKNGKDVFDEDKVKMLKKNHSLEGEICEVGWSQFWNGYWLTCDKGNSNNWSGHWVELIEEEK